jgi:hypothetical protein
MAAVRPDQFLPMDPARFAHLRQELGLDPPADAAVA